MLSTIVATVLVTVLVVLIAINVSAPERKLQRRIAHRYATEDEQFQREMSVLLGPAILPGNRVTALQNGDEIFPTMIDAIRGAQRTITFETYIYWAGEIGTEVAEALAERARAGVAVHVTVDWAGAFKMDDDLLECMRSAGVELHHYRPLHWYSLSRLNNRTHRKLLIVDGMVAFTGGVGIADPWLGHAQDSDHWRDMHFRIEGPVVAQVQAAFNDNWIKTTGVVLNGEAYFPPLEPLGDSPAHMFISSPAGGSESMHLMYLMSIASATKTLDLCAAYFVPDHLIRKALIDARERGVRVRILVPGAHIDSVTVKIASKTCWGELLQAGIEMYQFCPTMLHLKMLIVDGVMVSVGSTNFDRRSFRLNDEASLNVYDPDFAIRMTGIYETDLRRSEPYTYEDWKRRPLRRRVLERLLEPFRSQL
jgi:cardiolipin synthase A/B